ncbi:hypothetical protein ABL78_4182 [Leptomonas seymouri]|uniref:Uncharacterized protein n=1 Tax=Leptomonas seymouri TaxID=5684 RepID=A0A0N1HX02_LEPSE|nr:hypothetical protein ABL78_4182 [Leptomonas seymouri]|eukprot:KPI86765.1 hypothetical protein ABL78_4182 [Leptomonas seymouri]
MRQREQKWGVLWRYRPDNDPLASTRPTLSWMSTSGADNCGDAGAAAGRLGALRGQAEFTGLTGSSRPSFAPSTEQRSGGRGHKEALAHPQSFMTADSVESGADMASYVRASTVKSPFGHEGDPLLAFLQRHEDDAADLLAMWTSLHRSCVYASELSESVVLQVRYFFHSLLHNCAIEAAVEFYHRLMGLGVHLQQSDLLLLLSSLPYEGAASTVEEQLRRAKEDALMEKDRLLWAKRRQEFKEAARRAHAPGSAAEPLTFPKCVSESRKEASSDNASASVYRNEDERGPHATKDAAERAGTSSLLVAEEREAYPPSTIARLVAFHQQPEWIKRWILYEASMGTLDGLDSQEGLALPAAVDHGAHRSASANTSSHEDAAWHADTASHEDSAVESARATRMMEAAAIVDHLHLLMLGAMQRENAPLRLRPRPSVPSRSRTAFSSSIFPCTRRSSSAVERAHWREALRVVRNIFASPPYALPASLPMSFSGPLVLSGDIASTLQRMMRAAHTWEGALGLHRLRVPRTSQGNEPLREVSMGQDDFVAGAILFTALAATEQPWKTQASIETWMHQCMLPQLAKRTGDAGAAVAAIHALWLSHLCSVKAARPEQFILMTEEVAAYMPVPCASIGGSSTIGMGTAAQLLHAELSVIIAEVQVGAENAITTFRREVHEAMLSRRAAQALAKSIQSKAYQLNVEGTGEDASHAPLYGERATATMGAPRSSSLLVPAPLPCSPSLLSDAQVDAFVLCCAAMKETVWLRFSTAAFQDRASVTVDVLQFLERSFHGCTGLYAVFRELYGGALTPRHRNGGPGGERAPRSSATAAEAVAAPERPYVSTVLAVTLLEMVPLFCAPPSQSGHFGRPPANRDTLLLLVEFARRAVDGIQPAHIKIAPWRWAVEARIAELIKVTARTLHVMVRELDVQPRNERVMFGAVPQRDLQLLAELARLIIKTSDLASTQLQQRSHHRSEVHCPVWKILTVTASPHVLQGVQLCFRKSSPIGSRVRYHLTSHEGHRLDELLATCRSRSRVVRNSSNMKSVLPCRVGCLDAGRIPRTPMTDNDFVLAVAMRDAVYTSVQCAVTTESLRGSLQKLASASASWKASLLLCQLVTKDVGLAKGTCDMNFFTTVLARMTSDIAERKSVAVAAAMQSGSGAPSLRRSRGKGNGGARAAAAAVRVGPASLWLNAIDVFWSAVDHNAGNPADPTEHLRSPAFTPEDNDQRLTGAERQERAVLAELLLSLIVFSRTINRTDLGRQWRRTWAAKFSTAEKKSALFRRQNIMALSALGDRSALERCVSDYDALDHDDALLCQVAAQHSDWQRALEAVFKVHGVMEDKERTQSPYPLEVARTLITLLSRSPKNLSNTAMRLERLQGREWDAECSAGVVRLLLRARRWSLALQHVSIALTQQPALQRIHASITSATAASGAADGSSSCPSLVLTHQEAVHYVSLLTLALQATAIGGDSTTAPLYYDALKVALQCVFQPALESGAAARSNSAVDGAAGSTFASGGLDAVFEMASTSGTAVPDASVAQFDAEEVQSRAELRELAARARLLFFRAMTKKMMSMKGNSVGRVSDEDEDMQGECKDDDAAPAKRAEYGCITDAESDSGVHRR